MRDSCLIGGKEDGKPANRKQRTLWQALKTVMVGSVITVLHLKNTGSFFFPFYQPRYCISASFPIPSEVFVYTTSLSFFHSCCLWDHS